MNSFHIYKIKNPDVLHRDFYFLKKSTHSNPLKTRPCGMLNDGIPFDIRGQTIINIPTADRGDSEPMTSSFVGMLTPPEHSAQQRQ